MSRSKKALLAKRLGMSAVIVLVILVALPIAVKYAAIYGLEKAGAADVSVGDVDLNLFTGEFAVTQLSTGNNKSQDFSLSHFSLKLAYLPLFEKRLELESISIEGVDLNIREQQGVLHVVVPIPQSESESSSEESSEDETPPWGVGLRRVSVENVSINVDAMDIKSDVSIRRLQLSELKSWKPMNASAFSLSGAINGAPISVNADVQPFASTQQYETKVSIKELDLSPLAPFIKDHIQAIDAKVTIDSDVRIVLNGNGAIDLHQEGRLDINVSGLEREELALKESHLGWNGQVSVSLPLDSKPVVNTNGVLSSNKLDVELKELLFGVSHRGLALDGHVSVDTAHLEESLSLSGGFELKGLVVSDGKEPVLPISLKQVDVKDIALTGMGSLNIAEISLEELAMLVPNSLTATSLAQESATPALTLANISVRQVVLSGRDDLNIQDIVLDSANANIKRLKNGNIDVITAYVDAIKQRFASDSLENDSSESEAGNGKDKSSNSVAEMDGAEQVGKKTVDKKPAFQFSVGQFKVEGNNQISFSDHSVEPTYKEKIFIDKVLVGSISTKQSSVLTPVDVALRIGEFSTVKLSGALTPLQKMIEGNLAFAIAGVELTSLSAYVEQATGYAVGSGQFNLDSTFTFDKGKVQAANEVLLKQLVLTPVNEELIARVSKQFTMPIGVSLGLLKDSDGNIALSVPLSGDLSDPSVNIPYVVQQALVQAIKNGTLSYLKYAMQPYGAILLVGEAVGDMVMKTKFAPVHFKSGTAEITDGDQQYMPKLANVLMKLPHLTIKMCPIVTSGDLLEGEKAAMNDRLVKLGADRLTLVKSILTSDYKVSPERVLFCRAKWGEGKPRVELE